MADISQHWTSQNLLDQHNHERKTFQYAIDHLCESPKWEAGNAAGTQISPSKGHTELHLKRALEPRGKAREAFGQRIGGKSYSMVSQTILYLKDFCFTDTQRVKSSSRQSPHSNPSAIHNFMTSLDLVLYSQRSKAHCQDTVEKCLPEASSLNSLWTMWGAKALLRLKSSISLLKYPKFKKSVLRGDCSPWHWSRNKKLHTNLSAKSPQSSWHLGTFWYAVKINHPDSNLPGGLDAGYLCRFPWSSASLCLILHSRCLWFSTQHSILLLLISFV